MDIDTYNWFYGGVEYAFICDETLGQTKDFIENNLLPALEQEEQARYEAESLAARRKNHLLYGAGAGLLLGIITGALVAN